MFCLYCHTNLSSSFFLPFKFLLFCHGTHLFVQVDDLFICNLEDELILMSQNKFQYPVPIGLKAQNCNTSKTLTYFKPHGSPIMIHQVFHLGVVVTLQPISEDWVIWVISLWVIPSTSWKWKSTKQHQIPTLCETWKMGDCSCGIVSMQWFFSSQIKTVLWIKFHVVIKTL